MTEQPEALRLADRLEQYEPKTPALFDAAAELRHLHSVNAQLLEALEDCREALRRAGAIGELLVVDNAIGAAKEKACKSAS